MVPDKIKRLIAGYRKAVAKRKFSIIAIISLLLGFYFLYSELSSTTKEDLDEIKEILLFDDYRDLDLKKNNTPLRSPSFIRNSKEVNEIFDTGSILVWFKIDSLSNKKEKCLHECVNYYNETAFKLYISNNSILNFEIFDNHNRKYSLSYISSETFTKFTVVDVTWASKKELKLYFNGKCVSTQKVNDATFSNPVRDFYIGSGYSKGSLLNGVIKEIRLSKKVFSKEWIQTTYNNLSDPGSFAIPGPTQKVKN